MQSSSQGRYGYPGYQGYPYVNPVVHDVPSIDPQTASRWANLPRRPLDSPSVSGPASNSAGGSSSQPSRSSSQERQGSRYQGYPYVTPVYTDVSGSMSPGGSGSGSTAANSSQASQRPQTPGTTTSDTVPPKKDIDENPVVYIDLPEAGSEVSRSIGSPADDDDEPEFVHNTIMYDPFENRRIDMPKDEERTVASSEAGGSSSGYTQQQFQNSPMRPSTLNIAGGSGSSTQSPASTSRQTPIIPSFMSKESQVYGGSDGADGFPLSPIPISEFPEPPPAYTEVDERSPSRAVESPRADTPRAAEPPPPPRTQVIVNEQGGPMNRPMPIASPVNIQTPITSPLHGPIATPAMNPMRVQMPVMAPTNYYQKHLLCHHCGTRVYTMVDKQIGPMTHFVACMVFFIFVPFVIVVYIADYFKYKNHYCSNCFKLIGYETPIVGQKVTYVT